MTTPCPSNPAPPEGYEVWQGPVPTELTQWAKDLLATEADYPFWTTWQMDYNGQTVIARKDYHTWTYRGGQLVTGICVPGITLYQPIVVEGSDPTIPAVVGTLIAAIGIGATWWLLKA